MSLGKGLESLIPPQPSENGVSPSSETEGQVEESHTPPFRETQESQPKEEILAGRVGERRDNIFYIETNKITPNPHQPRREFNQEELESLAVSIRQFGVLQPLVVTKKEIEMPYGRRVEYELLAGERRLRAARLAGFSQVPVIIREAGGQEKLELALIENVQRSDLNPIEEAEAYKKLADDFFLTQESIASRVGKSRETVANKLRLLTLPQEVQQYIADELLTEGHGKVLLSVESPERVRMLAKEAIRRAWSVRALEMELRKQHQASQAQSTERDPQLERYRELIEEHLGTTVSISGNPEKGRLTFSFHSHDDLERLISRLAGPEGPSGSSNTPQDEEELPEHIV